MQYTAIQEQFNSVIEYSQGYSGVNTDELFEKWLDAKRDFIEVMGGKLIYEYPETVYFELGPKEKSLRVDDFISMVENRWDNYDLSLFIEAQKEGFFSNQVVESYNYNGQIIPKGMKLLKAFKFFERNTKVLNDIQSGIFSEVDISKNTKFEESTNNSIKRYYLQAGEVEQMLLDDIYNLKGTNPRFWEEESTTSAIIAPDNTNIF